MTLFQIALKAYGQANRRLHALEIVSLYDKTPEERMELNRQFGDAISEAVLAKAALDALQGTGPAPFGDHGER